MEAHGDGHGANGHGGRGVGPAHIGVAREMRIAAAAGRRAEDLHVCPRCGSDLVQPTRWQAIDEERWQVELRCPECRWCGGGVYEQAVLDRFDETLDAGLASLVDDLERLERENMEEQGERFLAALRSDRILPEDF